VRPEVDQRGRARDRGWLSLSGEQNEAKYLTDQGVPIIGGLGVPAEYASPLSYPTTPSLVTAGPRSARMPARSASRSPGHLPQRQLHPTGQGLVAAAMKKQGITPVDVEQVDATKADYTDIVLKFQASGAQSVAAFLDPSPTPASSRRWSARTASARPRRGLDKASANAQYASGCGSSCAVFGADSVTPVLEYLDHQSTPAIAQYLNAGTRTTRSVPRARRLHHVPVGGSPSVRAGDQGHRQRSRQPQSLVSALNNLHNYDNGASRLRSPTGQGTTTPCTASSGCTTRAASGRPRPAGTASDEH